MCPKNKFAPNVLILEIYFVSFMTHAVYDATCENVFIVGDDLRISLEEGERERAGGGGVTKRGNMLSRNLLMNVGC